MYRIIKFSLSVGYIMLFFLYKSSSTTIPVTFDANPKESCIGCTISFSVNSVCNLENATFYWTFGDGSECSTYVPYTSHTYNNPGMFNASVLVVKSDDSGSDDITIDIYKLGSFTIDAESVFDIKGNPLQFHIHAWKNCVERYQWQ
ncbi:MAG: PKD domain-containing protein [Candidatus Omnitrophica bacterium]|nr:PKD domain-containing protein [Candidatus Omnitrophota bacterium]MCM8803524.1 PKD domain-containing protein [Candidatus Omnitrophota bacterium]